jgi:glycerol-3-phosphate acyltransferase PlsY
MTAAIFSGCAMVAYLLGSVPTGLLWGLARGLDVRTVGSGNIGATNVMRALGIVPGALVLLLDAAKGFVPVFLAPRVFAQADATALQIVCCVAVIAGHNWPCWLRFQGGKGVATSAGALLAFLPGPLGCAVAAWAVVFVISRYVSLASIVAAVCMPLATWVIERDAMLVGFTAFLGAVAVYKHRGNIRRLLAGTENRVARFGRRRSG